MIALLGSLLGFVTSIFPEVLKVFRDKHDRQHELLLLDKQIEFSKLKSSLALEEAEIVSNSRVYEALYQHAQPVGVKWVDALAGSVRPCITYAFFMLYACVKLAQLKLIASHTTHWVQALPSLWHQEDQALFATVIAFWFGQRLLNRYRGGR